jgi:predicted adenine nucleotide alpha hydrolase (AANH) superfamily ATPase
MDSKKRAYSGENMVDAGANGADGVFELAGAWEKAVVKPTLLLHSCCGPCSTSVVERLAGIYRITIFFYNPNITDRAEYEKRKAAQTDFIRQYNREGRAPDRLDFIEGAYEPALFEAAARGLEDAPEGGARCGVCVRLRLEKTAETAVMRGFDCFATTLTVSPHKNCGAITHIGVELGLRYRIGYLAEDFKKQNGYRRSVELSKRYGLYRQSSCGCRFAGPDGRV